MSNQFNKKLDKILKIVNKYIDNDPDGKAGYLKDMRKIKELATYK